MTEAKELIVSEIIVEETGLPLKFPDPAEEAYARAQEFRCLSPEARLKEIAAMMDLGLQMVRASPRRAEIEKIWQAQELEWQNIQKEIFRRYAST